MRVVALDWRIDSLLQGMIRRSFFRINATHQRNRVALRRTRRSNTTRRWGDAPSRPYIASRDARQRRPNMRRTDRNAVRLPGSP